MHKVWGAAIALTLAGCSGEGDLASDFRLQLSPHFLDSQDVLGASPEIKLLLLQPNGAEQLTHLGQASRGGELTLDGLPPIPSGTIVGLVAEAAGSTGPDWNPSAMLAYGQARVVEDLDLTQDAQLDILVASTEEIGRLDELSAAKKRLGGALVVVPGGSAYVFGGGDPADLGRAPISSKTVLALRSLNEGGTSFDSVGDIPSFPAEVGGVDIKKRTGMSATVVEVDGAPMILVAGGRGDWGDTSGNVKGWFLWDPATDSVFDQGDLKTSRSDHLAVSFGNGDVLLLGGLSGDGIVPGVSYEIFEAARRRTAQGTNADRLAMGQRGLFGAALDGDVVVCGGTTPTGLTSTVWTPSAGCSLVQVDGDVETFPPLPVPLGAAAMASLPNGGLLVAGGFEEAPEDLGQDFGEVPAIADAWVYEPGADAWRAAGPLNRARAHHRMVALPDGTVLVVGGTEQGTAIFGDIGPPVRCPEVYDPQTDAFTEIECTDVGQGADPLVGSYPGEPVVVTEGYWVDYTQYLGAGEYGVMGSGPPI